MMMAMTVWQGWNKIILFKMMMITAITVEMTKSVRLLVQIQALIYQFPTVIHTANEGSLLPYICILHIETYKSQPVINPLLERK